MGCGGSKDGLEAPQAPLNHFMVGLGMEKLDGLFAEASKVIEEIEELRVVIVDKKDDLVISTGACSFSDPKISHCILGLLWKLSADNSGKFLDAGFDFDASSLSIKLTGSKNSSDAVKAIDEVNAYVSGLRAIPEKLSQLADKISEFCKNSFEDPTAIFDELSKSLSGNPFKIPGKLMDCKKNIVLVKNAVATANKLREELTNTLSFFKDIKNLISADKLVSIDEIGSKANKAKHTKPYEICWNYMTDVKERFGKKAEEGVKKWDGMKLKKKSVKQSFKSAPKAETKAQGQSEKKQEKNKKKDEEGEEKQAEEKAAENDGGDAGAGADAGGNDE
jgi:hypothetical protein